MMIQEFEKLTGIEVNAAEYSVIEEMYYDFDGDKRAFCKKFMQDNGLVEVLRTIATNLEAEKCEALSELKIAKEKAAKLETQLEREQEWEPYEYRENVKQADYERLADPKAGSRELSDEEAIKLLADWWGFQPGRITIYHEVNRLEKNRHNFVRTAGTYDRKPLYNATDWNYIRFDCGMMTYEMHNGELQFFVH